MARESYEVDVTFDGDKIAAMFAEEMANERALFSLDGETTSCAGSEDALSNESCCKTASDAAQAKDNDAALSNGDSVNGAACSCGMGANACPKDEQKTCFADEKHDVGNEDIISQDKAFKDIKANDKTCVLSNDAQDDKIAEEKSGEDINKKQENKFGKFANPQELYKAYLELEKEFTRRSQKLKELEGNEVAFKNEEEWKSAADKFFELAPSARKFARDIAQEIYSRPELKRDKNCFLIAFGEVMAKKFRTPQQLLDDGQFVEQFVLGNKKVKDAIIGDYLEALRLNAPPKTMQSGGMQCVAPLKTPRTVEEAGSMFLKNNQ